MSDMTPVNAIEPGHTEDTAKDQNNGDAPDNGGVNQRKEEPKITYQWEEEALRKKYGGMLPKKVPLISKDHERAFFDSADWALGKQGSPVGKPKGPLEALRPKLQPTPHQRSRRSAYAPPDGEDGANPASEDTNSSNCGDNLSITNKAA